ncbi:hypothetical protein FQR65_LT00834 [Abscondita terminalis]|nr:hypothetical protein FQR65_LT00834 [Abscondita terminalis]
MQVLLVILMVADLSMSKRWPLRFMDEWMALSQPYHDVCISNAKPNLDDIDKLTSKAYVSNNDATCNYLKCLLQHFKVFNSDGEISKNLVMETATYMNSEVTDKCIAEAINEKNPIKKSCAFTKCIINFYAE